MMGFTYTDKLLHLALLHALLELALLVGVESSQSVRIRDVVSYWVSMRHCGSARWDNRVHLIHGCCGGACVRACAAGWIRWLRIWAALRGLWGQNAAKEIWELLSALVMSRSRGSQPGTRACTDLCPLLRAYSTVYRGRFLSGGSFQLRSIDVPTVLDPSPVISCSPPSQSRFQPQKSTMASCGTNRDVCLPPRL